MQTPTGMPRPAPPHRHERCAKLRKKLRTFWLRALVRNPCGRMIGNAIARVAFIKEGSRKQAARGAIGWRRASGICPLSGRHLRDASVVEDRCFPQFCVGAEAGSTLMTCPPIVMLIHRIPCSRHAGMLRAAEIRASSNLDGGYVGCSTNRSQGRQMAQFDR